MEPQLAKTDIVELPDSTIDGGQNTVAASSGDTVHTVAEASCQDAIQSSRHLLAKIEDLFPTRLLRRESPERGAILNLLADELEGIGMDLRQAGDFLSCSPEVRRRFRQLVCELMNPRDFIAQRSLENHGYSGGYREPKPIADQVTILDTLLPGIGKLTKWQTDLPAKRYGEGYFATPSWQKLGNKDYLDALMLVLKQLEQQHNGKFHNLLGEKLSPHRLMLDPRTEAARQKLVDQQGNLRFVVARAQFGVEHAGESVQRVREVLSAREFAADPCSVGCWLLSHPKRLSHPDDLWIDCPGLHFDARRNGSFDHALFFRFSADGEICLDAGCIENYNNQYGSATFFVEDLQD